MARDDQNRGSVMFRFFCSPDHFTEPVQCSVARLTASRQWHLHAPAFFSCSSPQVYYPCLCSKVRISFTFYSEFVPTQKESSLEVRRSLLLRKLLDLRRRPKTKRYQKYQFGESLKHIDPPPEWFFTRLKQSPSNFWRNPKPTQTHQTHLIETFWSGNMSSMGTWRTLNRVAKTHMFLLR